MYYRLRPPNELMWLDLAIDDKLVTEHNVDLDRLTDDWKPTGERAFSQDLLRIALRYGHRTTTGLAVRATHTTELGHADELRRLTEDSSRRSADVRASATGQMLEKVMPGWNAHGEDLDRRIREGMEESAQESDQDLAETLAAPVKPELADHWTALGGVLPD